jgi:hypothetical protein
MRISIASSGRCFVRDDGKPFFWLADTAWNAALRGDPASWRRYCAARRQQGFTVVQFVTAPWRGCREPRHGPLFRQTADGVEFGEHAWGMMEEWMALLVENDLVPAPVMFWDNNPDEELFRLRDETCVAAATRMLERWRRFDPVWILAGDGDYRVTRQDERWKALGRAIFDGRPGELCTMHPCGRSWVGDQFADEPWYSFVGIQSGHGTSRADLGFLVAGPWTQRWKDIRKPFVNLEPNYELAVSYQEPSLRFTARHVRRAAWWSLLGAPAAGITYGNNPVWTWAQAAGERAEGHDSIWTGGPWTAGLQTEGIDSLSTLRAILAAVPWTYLLPADHLLAGQPGWDEPAAYQKVAATPDLGTIVAYLPEGGTARFCASMLPPAPRAGWIDPRTASETPGELSAHGAGAIREARAPSSEDWLLVLRSTRREARS